MIEMTVKTKLDVHLWVSEKFLHLSEVSRKPLVFSGGSHTAIDPAMLLFVLCVKGFGINIVFDLFLTLPDDRGARSSFDTSAEWKTIS